MTPSPLAFAAIEQAEIAVLETYLPAQLDDTELDEVYVEEVDEELYGLPEIKQDSAGAPVVEDDQQYLGVFSEKCCMSVLTMTARLACEGEKSLARRLHARDVIVESKYTAFSIAPAIGLETFEAGARIVKDVRCRMQRQRRERFDRRLAPLHISGEKNFRV